MQKHSCKTYYTIGFEFDEKKNVAVLRDGRDCSPEELGIFDKDEVEKFVVENFGIIPEWRRHHFVLGLNEQYNVDVNEMIRVTLKNLLGKEDKIRQMQKLFSVQTALEIVPYIVAESEEPTQLLSLDDDIIAFLYKSCTAHDLDYYII